jgi:putative ABC transport system permease protein
MTQVLLTPTDLGLAALLLVLAAVLSFSFRLQLERTMAIAAVRMVVQLLLVGLVLKFVFEQTSLWLTAAVAAAMILFAALEAAGRTAAPGLRPALVGLGGATLLAVGLFATLFAAAAVIRPDPWHAPRYVIPILGMVLGNALTAVGLVFQSVMSMAQRERRAIEARLALGETRHQALAPLLREALATALTPILNAMAVAGIVSLPGMMTGQVIAGVDPIEAAKYQIVIMLVLAGAVALAAVAAGLGSVLLLTDRRDRLRLDRITGQTAGATTDGLASSGK